MEERISAVTQIGSYLDRFCDGISGYGDRLAIETDTGNHITYRELLALVDRFTGALHQSGIRQNSHVILHNLSNAEAVVAVLAVARLGAVSIMARAMPPRILATPPTKVIV